MPPAGRGETGGTVLVGISAWTEPTLVKAGTFYPKKTMSAEERLRFYASQFPVAEVDSTYYAPPTVRNAELWIERTPKDFVFDIKAFALLTGHPARVDRLPKDLAAELPEDLAAKKNVYRDKAPAEWVDEVWERFREALFPLHSAGKLGAVLFQFPQWFLPGRASKDYLVECAERLPDYRIAVEFRHQSWLSEKNAERTLGVPRGARPSARLRRHAPGVRLEHAGRWPPPREGRWRWCDSTGGTPRRGRRRGERPPTGSSTTTRGRELEEWAPRIDELAAQARETHVIMNNCYRDYAVKSARQMASLLDLDE